MRYILTSFHLIVMKIYAAGLYFHMARHFIYTPLSEARKCTLTDISPCNYSYLRSSHSGKAGITFSSVGRVVFLSVSVCAKLKLLVRN